MISVLSLLWIFWTGLVAMGGLLLILWFFLTGDEFRKARRIVIPIAVALTIGLWIRSQGNEERTGNQFLVAWQAASADYPDGRMNTPEMSEYLDMKRIGSVDGYLPQRFRLLEKSPVRSAGDEELQLEGLQSPVSTKVYLSDVRMHSQEGDADYNAQMRIWVAQDNDLVVKFMFENIRFQ